MGAADRASMEGLSWVTPVGAFLAVKDAEARIEEYVMDEETMEDSVEELVGDVLADVWK